MFSIISSLLILALIFFFVAHSYKKQKRELTFPAWLAQGTSSFFKPHGIKKLKISYQEKVSSSLSKTGQTLVGGLLICFIYLFVSGFYFSLFSSQRMYGIPLMLHVFFGCFFALLMCAVLIFYAKEFNFIVQESEMKPSLVFDVKKALFWLFALSSLTLVTTSLLMMIPVFIYQTQLVFFEVHRYSALLSVLAALGLLYTSLSDHEKAQK